MQIPLGVTEDRLVGTVDIEASMKVSSRGLGGRVEGEEHSGKLEVADGVALEMGKGAG